MSKTPSELDGKPVGTATGAHYVKATNLKKPPSRKRRAKAHRALWLTFTKDASFQKQHRAERPMRLLQRFLNRQRAKAGDSMAPRLVKGTHGQE